MKKTVIHIAFVFLLLGAEDSHAQWEYIHTFHAQYAIQDCYFSFSDPQNGWAVYSEMLPPGTGNNVYVAKTTNYGKDWIPFLVDWNFGVGVTDIAAPHSDTIYYLKNENGGRLYYSYDAGNTWHNKHLYSNYPGDLFAINGHTIYITTGGYSAYSGLYKYSQDTLSTLLLSNTIRFLGSKIHFSDPDHGKIIAKDMNDNSILLSSDDGFNNWEVVYTTEAYDFKDLYFTSDSVGYISCMEGDILATSDGGSTFHEMSTPTHRDLYCIQFVNDSCGYAAGDYGVCIHTTNYGNSWLTESVNTAQRLISLQMFGWDQAYLMSWFNLLYAKDPLMWNGPRKEAEAAVYPNPTSGLLHINMASNAAIDKLCMYDLLGNKQSLNTADKMQLDVSHLQAGMYLLYVTTDESTYVEKIMKK